MTKYCEGIPDASLLPENQEAERADMWQARAEELQKHLARVLYLYQGAWHPDSILMQEHGHEIEAARQATYRFT